MKNYILLVHIAIIFIFNSCAGTTPNFIEVEQARHKQNKKIILNIDTLTHKSGVNDLIVTKDKKHLVTCSADKTVLLTNLETGIVEKKYLGEVGDGFGSVNAIALSPDEKYLVTGGWFAEGNNINNDKVGWIRVYDFKTAKIVNILKGQLNTIKSLEFSNDGKYLVSLSYDHSIYVRSVPDFNLVHKEIRPYDIHAVKIFDNKIVYIDDNWNLRVVGLPYGQLIKSKRIVDIGKILMSQIADSATYDMKNLPIYKHIAVNKNNIAVSTKYKEHKIIIFDYNLNIVTKIDAHKGATGIKFDNNGRYLIVGESTGTVAGKKYVRIYDADNNYRLVSSFDKFDFFPSALGFLGNTKAIAVGDYNNNIRVWNINDASEVKSIKGIGNAKPAVAFIGNKVIWRNEIITLKKELDKYYDIDKMKLVNEKIDISNIIYPKHEYKNYELKHSIDRKGLFLLKDGKAQFILKSDSIHNIYRFYKNYIFSGTSDGVINIFSLDGKLLYSLQGHNGSIRSAHSNDKFIVSSGDDKTIRFWKLPELSNDNKVKIVSPVASLFIANDDSWIMWTPEGYFNATKNSTKYIGYHINQGSNKEAEYVTVDALYSTFYRPDLVQKSLAGESLEKYAKNINIQKLLQDGLPPEVHILTDTTNSDKQDMDLKVQVCPKEKGGFDNLTLLINDMPVSVIDTSRGLKLKKKSKRDDCFVYNQSITLAGGKNTIGFRATNKAGNIESKPDFLEVTFDDTDIKKKLRSKLAKISGKQNINDLHILAIAVNKYKDKDLQLKYSINDATVMLDTIKNVAKPLFKKIYTHKLFDKYVTKENIKKAFKEINSTREDVFLLYIAGHGITDEYNGNYYYIPYDFIDKDDDKVLQTQGVGQRDLMLGLSNITALKSLVLLDTCNSGSFVEANMQKTTTNRLARATGRATISASSSNQVAYEGYEGHGVFTYTLIEALKGKGYNSDNKITINELNNYVEDVLPDRTSKKWGYRQMPQSSMYGTDFNIGEK